MGDMERFDSTALFSIFKNDDGENLLPFDEMAALLDLGPEVDVPLISNAPLVATEGTPASYIINGNGQTASTMPSAVPTTSDGGDSDHTKTPGWGSDGDGDSDGMADTKQDDGGQPSSTITGAGIGVGRSSGKGTKATSGVKKRRQRNVEQMESNRVAQQKYRQRKKVEQNALQQAVDMLTTQVAALKAVEVRAGKLEASNVALQSTVSQQGASLAALQLHSGAQAAELEATRAALMSSQATVASQNKIISDQQAKLHLQEEVIASLKDRLKERIDEAMLHMVPGTVCEKMVAAVKATLYGAKDVHGLQETLAQLPEHLVVELCKNIFQVCKEMWPELRTRCGRQVGDACMTGTA